MANQDAREPGAAGPITPMKILGVQGSPSPVADTDPAPPPKVPSTDPGVAPPAGVQAQGAHRAQNVRVPPGGGPNDSVEELLGTMAEPPKPPPRLSPDSSGKAAVSYHVQHGLHPAQETPVPEAKVIVEKLPLMATLRLDRSKLPQLPSEAQPRRAEPTVVIPKAQGPRVLVALFSAVLVVFGIFVVMKLWSVKQKQNAMAADPTASALVEPRSSAQAGGAAAVAVAPTAPAEVATIASAVPEPPAAPSATAAATAVSSAVAPTGPTARTAAATAAAPPWAAPPDNPYVTAPTTAAPPQAATSAPKTDVKRTIN